MQNHASCVLDIASVLADCEFSKLAYDSISQQDLYDVRQLERGEKKTGMMVLGGGKKKTRTIATINSSFT